MDNDVLEALRSAQELCSYLWDNTDSNVELVAHSEKHAESLAALLNDAKEKIECALHGIEIQRSDVGSSKAHGPVSERLMARFYGPRY